MRVLIKESHFDLTFTTLRIIVDVIYRNELFGNIEMVFDAKPLMFTDRTVGFVNTDKLMEQVTEKLRLNEDYFRTVKAQQTHINGLCWNI